MYTAPVASPLPAVVERPVGLIIGAEADMSSRLGE
jgi:hypothetical protein